MILTPQEIDKAYWQWALRDYPYLEIDLEIEPFLNIPAYTASTPAYLKLFLKRDRINYNPTQFGKLRKTRKALFLSAHYVAKKLKILRPQYSRFEKNEETGAVTLKELAKAAEAMDCELIYAIRPKNKLSFSKN